MRRCECREPCIGVPIPVRLGFGDVREKAHATLRLLADFGS